MLAIPAVAPVVPFGCVVVLPFGRAGHVYCRWSALLTGSAPRPAVYDADRMRYELFMSHALAEASDAAARGERPDGAVAVQDDAMVASASNQVNRTGDPTAHA